MSPSLTLNAVLCEHEQELRGFMLRKLGCAQLAADIFQDLVERLLQRPVTPPDNPRAYLFQAAANAITDHFRSERCRQIYANRVMLQTDREEDAVSPERIVAAQQLVKLIESALAELPPLTQEIFRLYRIEGLSQQAIATELSISRSTVERRLQKAIDHWRKRIQP